jgi:integrase
VSLYKRPESRYWWCKVTVSGETVRRTTGTASKSQARLFEDRLRQQLWELKKLGKVAYTWDLAAEKWLEESAGKRSLHSDEGILAWFQPHLTGKKLVEIDRAKIDELRALKDASPSTVNRHFALLRAILRRARDEWEWIGQIPAVPMYSLEEPEPMWITREKFEELVRALLPAWERPARFAVVTGLRRTPIITLTWPNVDLKRKHAWISALRSKNKKPIPLPLGPEAIRILRTVKGQHDEFVFSYNGGPVPAQNGYYWEQWRAAVKSVGLKGFRFHDLRHTWASWHIQNGTPPHILRELGGWSDDKMVRRYAHLGAEHLAEWAHNIGHRPKRKARK